MKYPITSFYLKSKRKEGKKTEIFKSYSNEKKVKDIQASLFEGSASIKQCKGNSGKTIETSKQHIDGLDDNREVVIEAFHSINYLFTNSYDDESRLSCSSPTEKQIEPVTLKERKKLCTPLGHKGRQTIYFCSFWWAQLEANSHTY